MLTSLFDLVVREAGQSADSSIRSISAIGRDHFDVPVDCPVDVESTARAAAHHGLEVTFVVDAMRVATAAEDAHALRVVLPGFGEVTTTDAMLARLHS